ncbi:unnamed protein product, partial [Didymodactylos carnosus]
MVANLTSRWTYIPSGQKLAYFDPFPSVFSAQTFEGDVDTSTKNLGKSPKPIVKKGFNSDRINNVEQVPSHPSVKNLKSKIPSDTDVIESDSELKYLGRIVSAQGIRPDPGKLEAVRSFPIPEGRPFEVWTNHRSLQWLRNVKDPTSRLARWAMKLDAYGMIIKHPPGESIGCP